MKRYSIFLDDHEIIDAKQFVKNCIFMNWDKKSNV